MRLELDGVSHRYGSETAVESVSFGLEDGELVAVLGPSGCGKTTLVQAIAGHVAPTAGRIRLRGADITDTPPEARDVGVVFQRSTLFPHMTVGENVGYGLDADGVPPARRETAIEAALELVELTAKRGSYPAALSGGETRRAELARALAPGPDVLLLDEPLSALDRGLRDQLRTEIARIHRETGVTALFVTHDQEEAMSLADRLVVLRDGEVSAVGDPRTLYESPPNRFVAAFLGRSNTLPATIVERNPPALRVGESRVPVDGLPEGIEGADPVVHVRPGDVDVSRNGRVGTDVELSGTVRSVTDVASRYDVRVRVASGTELVAERRRSCPAVEESVAVGFDRRDLTVLPGADADGDRA